MSSKVKQANFRLPLEYMSMIDDFANRESITKAAVITRALDCMKASYDAGNGGMPVTAAEASAAENEVKELREKLAAAEAKVAEISAQLASANERANAAETRANDAVIARDAAESRAAQATANAAAVAIPAVAPAAISDEEAIRLKTLVATQEATLEEKAKTLVSKEAEIAAKDAEITAKNTTIAERDARIATLQQQLGEANARAQFAGVAAPENQAFTFDGASNMSEESMRALSMVNMLGSVMGAFKNQVEDARKLGEEEGRKAAREEFKDVVSKARNDGYRDAMTYLDDRVNTAREAGAKEERARIANMGFFERRRYLKVHLA